MCPTDACSPTHSTNDMWEVAGNYDHTALSGKQTAKTFINF